MNIRDISEYAGPTYSRAFFVLQGITAELATNQSTSVMQARLAWKPQLRPGLVSLRPVKAVSRALGLPRPCRAKAELKPRLGQVRARLSRPTA